MHWRTLVHPDQNILFDEPDSTNGELSREINQIVDGFIAKDTFKNALKDLMLEHYRIDWPDLIEDKSKLSKDEFLKIRRSLPRETLRGEIVKSHGEKMIGDFLFEHDVPYRYERNHYWNGINYRPDFTIPKTSDTGVVIEYFGLKGDDDYDEASERKRQYWRAKDGWSLLEYSPSDVSAHRGEAFWDILREDLYNMGVPCVHLSEDEIWHRIQDRSTRRFASAVVGFISRCRKLSITPDELLDRIKSYDPISPSEHRFLSLASTIYPTYLEQLQQTGDDDFNGLLVKAVDAVNSGSTVFRRRSGTGDIRGLRYVSIDEYQDFSDLFFQLVNAMLAANDVFQLFCVGDDWQAINGFAGSDLSFFELFDKTFKRPTQLYMTKNYRSCETIVDVGNALMRSRGKPALASRAEHSEVLVGYLDDLNLSVSESQVHAGDMITPAIIRIVANALRNDDGHVAILCRRNRVPYYVHYEDATPRGSLINS